MKVGILGGSFNPPHAGHLHISKLALEKIEPKSSLVDYDCAKSAKKS